MEAAAKIIIDKLLIRMPELRASDLHFKIGHEPVYKVDGKYRVFKEDKVVDQMFLDEILEIFEGSYSKKKLEEKGYVIFIYKMQEKASFRVNLYRLGAKISIAIRYIPKIIPNFSELKLSSFYNKLPYLDKGLFIISGSAGSGKSTLAASILQAINNDRIEHIASLSDPLEFVVPDDKSVINQVQLDDIDNISDFFDLQKKADTSIIFVDTENDKAIEKAVELSASGILVYLVLQAQTIQSALEKLFFAFPKDRRDYLKILISENLIGAAGMNLLTRVGGGQLLVDEYFLVDSTIRAALKSGKSNQVSNLLQNASDENTRSLDKSLAEYVKTGEIRLSDAKEYAENPENLSRY